MKIGEDIHIMATSDIHGILPDIPPCDVLCIAGDITPIRGSHHPLRQINWLNSVFAPWCESLKMPVIMTPGNHDFVFEKIKRSEWKVPTNLFILINQVYEFEGVKFYGSPWCPVLRNWAFYRDNTRIRAEYGKIPSGLDVLVTHSPPTVPGHNVDAVFDAISNEYVHLGTTVLANEILRSRPKFVVCGHIHSGSHDPVLLGESVITNVSLLDEAYQIAYPVVELKGL